MLYVASIFNERLRELGLSQEALARMTGISWPVVQRILSGKHDTPGFANVQKIASALGFEIELKSIASAQDIREHQARQKAEGIVRQVQGTSALEAQPVDAEHLEDMVRQTAHEFLAGPARNLWAE